MGLFSKIKQLFKFKSPKDEQSSKPQISKPRHLGTKGMLQRLKQQVTEIITKKPKISKPADTIRKEYYQQTKKLMATPETPLPYKSDIILQELESRIAKWSADADEETGIASRSNILKSTLEEQIQQYGRAKVAYACEQAGHQIITNAAVYVFDSDDNRRREAYTFFMILLKGEVLSADEAKDLGDAQDINEDYSPFEDE